MTSDFKCVNFQICNITLPDWWLDIDSKLICPECDMSFGELKFQENIECPVCYEKTTSVKLKNCDHTVCLDCFKRMYFGNDELENEPKFPYPDIEDEYDNNQEDPKWKDYPLIDTYNKNWNSWDDQRQEKFDNETFLKKCPLCRQ